MEETSQFYVPICLIVVRNILRVMHRHSGDKCFPQWLSLGGIPGYSDCTLGGIRGKKGFNSEELDISLGCHLPLVHLHPTSVVELGGMSMAPASVRDRLSPTREGNLLHKVCLHPHLEQGGKPPVERWCWSIFSLLQMGANNSSLTPLNCILKNWDRFDPQGLKKTHLVFLCDTAWPRYPLEDGERWPVGGSLKYNTVLQDRRQREEEKQASPIYPWDHMHRAARETEEQPHKLLPLYETPTGRNNQ